MTDTTTHPPGDAPDLTATLTGLAQILAGLGRDELARRTTAAIARTTRPVAVVCIVGEFKQGKSTLVNTLVGIPVCPVDDDLATAALTIVRHGPEVTAQVVHRAPDDGGEGGQAGDVTVTRVAPFELAEWVTEVGNPGNARGVERVDITAPGALLEAGVVFVDTPGAGGMHAGQAAATLAFLPFADGLVFVSDATSELTAPEVEFLREAAEHCPTVVMALTKTDLQPEWPRIRDLDVQHLAAAGLDIPVVPTSAALRQAAIARDDGGLDQLSGFHALVTELGARVMRTARATAGERAVAEARAAVEQVRAGLGAEREALASPAAATDAAAEVQVAQARLAHLQGPAARWQQVAGDRSNDLTNEVTLTFRGTIRDLTRRMDERIEALTTADEFEALSAELQTATAQAVADAFSALERGRATIREHLLDLIGAELPHRQGPEQSLDVAALWEAAARPQTGPSAAKRALQSTIGTLRGAQGGIIMFGMVGGFLPIAAGALLASAPVMLGVGALFASMSFGDDRQRRLTARRQQARQQVRQFLDDVGYQVSNRLAELSRNLTRELRDEFGELLGELHRTTREVLATAQATATSTAEQRAARQAEIGQALAALDATAHRLTALAG